MPPGVQSPHGRSLASVTVGRFPMQVAVCQAPVNMVAHYREI